MSDTSCSKHTERLGTMKILTLMLGLAWRMSTWGC